MATYASNSSSSATSGNASINSILGTTTIGLAPNSNWATYTGSSINYDSFINYPDEVTLKTILSALPEDKIEEMMDIVKGNLGDENFKPIIMMVVRSRHFTEDFLLKYVDFLDKSSIYVKHKENIFSREYHSLALLLEESEDKN